MEEEKVHVAVEPLSPGMSPVQLKDCIEEMLKFTLTSSIEGTLGLDIGLSKHYCSDLLKDDHHPNTSDLSGGVPTYPLYKALASALYQSISSGAFCSTYDTMTLIHDNSFLKQKDNEWIKLVLEKGSELLNMLKMVDFELHVQEPFFSQLNVGLKTIEGRCAVGDYNLIKKSFPVCLFDTGLLNVPYRIRPGALVLFNRCLVLQVQDVRRYASFREMLEAESLTEVLPGVPTIEEGVEIYRKFYSVEKERWNGVLAICVTKPASQLYNSMASMLLGLSYGGVQRLLGLVHTV